jgi:hypothetical protein
LEELELKQALQFNFGLGLCNKKCVVVNRKDDNYVRHVTNSEIIKKRKLIQGIFLITDDQYQLFAYITIPIPN